MKKKNIPEKSPVVISDGAFPWVKKKIIEKSFAKEVKILRLETWKFYEGS